MMSSWRDSFLDSGTLEDVDEQPPSDFEVSTEYDIYVPRQKWDYDIITEEEIEEVNRLAEQLSGQENHIPQGGSNEGTPLVGTTIPVSNRARELIGFLWSVAACFFLSLSLASIQLMHHQLPDNELNVARFLGSLVLVPPVLLYRCALPVIRTRSQILGAVAITILSYGFNFFLFAAVKHMPIGTESCIYRTAVLAVTTVLARIVMKERITVAKAIAIVVGVVGLVFITEPWRHDSGEKHSKLWLGYVFAAAAGIVASLKIIFQKRFCQETDVISLQFWTSLGCLIIAAVLMEATEHPSLPSERNDWLFLAAHAFSTGVATLLIYKAQQMISAILFGLSSSFNVFFSLMGQYTVLRDIQPGFRDAWEYSGAVLIVLSAVLVPAWKIMKTKCIPRRTELNQLP